MNRTYFLSSARPLDSWILVLGSFLFSVSGNFRKHSEILQKISGNIFLFSAFSGNFPNETLLSEIIRKVSGKWHSTFRKLKAVL